jgi:hypothetical protein
MTSNSERLDSERTSDYPATPGSQESPSYLELAQQIARESLEADHQALELDGKRPPAIHADRS